MSKFGIDNSKLVDNLLLYELTMNSEIAKNYDTIIVDSLKRLLSSSSKVVDEYLERIVKPFCGTGKTLILLHHVNKKGEIAGSTTLVELMDTVLLMKGKITSNLREIEVRKDRYGQGIKSCTVEMIKVSDHKARFEVREDVRSYHDAEKSGLKTAILSALEGNATLSFEDLHSCLKEKGFINSASIKNALKNLEDEGYLSKDDGKTWEIIQNRQNKTSEA
jgi:predicted ATP-dependent serine protease